MNTLEQADTTSGAQNTLRAQATSREAVLRLVAEGKLEKLFLMPMELGGVDVAANVLYVPHGVVQEKNLFDAQVMKLVEQDEVNYQAVPEYDDDSLLPARIVLEASGPEWMYHVIDVDTYL